MKAIRKLAVVLLMLAMVLPAASLAKEAAIRVDMAAYAVTENGEYTSMEEVAVYLTQFGHLPGNFISKRSAQALGWDSRAGNLDQIAPGKSIGGDRFGNYEGSLPDAGGRTWTECDIASDGGYRNGLRIVFSSDGLIYYTGDHYNTFTQVQVYGSPAKATATPAQATSAPMGTLDEDCPYTARDDVAAYLHQYGHLPSNYLTRNDAKALGWSSKKDNLGDVAPGYAIGGDTFGNREKLLPEAKNRAWFECDVNVTDGQRSDERLVYSSDGLIYYTPDSHKHFEQLY